MESAVAPACPAGGVILFDYRLLHRGLANSGSRDRPVAYAVCRTGLAWDRANFPPTRLREACNRLPQNEAELEVSKSTPGFQLPDMN